MEADFSDKTAKSIVIFGSGIALTACAYAAFRYWKRRDPKNIDEGFEPKSIDEGFEDVFKLEENPEKRIIVLGLESAGKSTILAQVTSGTIKNDDVKPTEGFNVTCLHIGNISLNIWEIGGSESVRKYWGNFLQDTDLLVFVVDASVPRSLPLAVKEVKTLLGDDRLTGVPVLILANKQDKPGAMSPEEVADALDVGSIPSSKHKVKVLGTQTRPDSQTWHPSIAEVEHVLLYHEW